MNRKLSKLHLKFNIIVFLTIICIFGVAQYNHYTDLRSDYLNVVKRISQRLSGKFDFFYHNVQNISFNSSVKRLNPTNSILYFDSLVALYPSYDFANRIAVLSVGSNRAPVQLNRKFGESAEVPVTPVRVHNCDVVHVANLAPYNLHFSSAV